MEYDNKNIDILLDKKFIECAAFKSKYKDLYKNIKKQKVYPLHMCGNSTDNKTEMICDIYNSYNEYDGYSFLSKEGFYDNGFTDDIEEAFSFSIPGWPSIPGIPKAYHPGWCTAPLSKTDCGWDGCCNRCCSARCGGCSKCWIRDEKTCYSPWEDAGTPSTPGIPGIKINFDVPSISDMYNEMKNKIDSEVIEPFSGYQTRLFDDVHETLQPIFQENTKEFLAIIVFCIIWILSTTLTENRLIILLLSSFVASLFYICIRDLNGILYTQEKPNIVRSEALK